MSLLGLFSVAVVVDYALFTLFNYIRNLGDETVKLAVGNYTLVIVAAMVVWLPLAMWFYLRTRAETSANAKRVDGPLHKFLFSVFMVVNILTAAVFVFVALYSSMRALVDVGSDVADTMMRVAVPSLLAACTHAGILLAYRRNNRPSRRQFAFGFTAVGVLLMLVLFGLTIGVVRDEAHDNRRTEDLDKVQQAIGMHYTENDTLPSGLTDISVEGLVFDKADYIYRPQPQLEASYQLCAEFKTSTKDTGSYYGPDDYSSYPSYYYHDKGQHCFKVAINKYEVGR